MGGGSEERGEEEGRGKEGKEEGEMSSYIPIQVDHNHPSPMYIQIHLRTKSN